MNEQITIDGSFGEGGGQILRTSLALSMITRTPIRIEKIRAGREKPGLLRQHLTAVNAAAAVCSAKVEGAAIGSRELTFEPGEVKAGEYAFAVGSAGSATLVVQTVLPALLVGEKPSTLSLEGGTHNPHAPPLDFLEKAFAPLVNRMGPTVQVTKERAGFYPAGGGRFCMDVTPAKKLQPLHLAERGPVTRRLARAVVAGLPPTIATRELDRVSKVLKWLEDELRVEQWDATWGPGNVLMLEVQSGEVTELFAAFGMRGTSAETVAENAAREARDYLAADVPVGSHLADQLLLPMALAGGGSFLTQEPTLHTRTNAEVIATVLPVRVEFAELKKDRWQVTLYPAGGERSRTLLGERAG
jgi:RNA 3'-terminal phosphate cyclase (ATP)